MQNIISKLTNYRGRTTFKSRSKCCPREIELNLYEDTKRQPNIFLESTSTPVKTSPHAVTKSSANKN